MCAWFFCCLQKNVAQLWLFLSNAHTDECFSVILQNPVFLFLLLPSASSISLAPNNTNCSCTIYFLCITIFLASLSSVCLPVASFFFGPFICALYLWPTEATSSLCPSNLCKVIWSPFLNCYSSVISWHLLDFFLSVLHFPLNYFVFWFTF